MSRQLFGTDGIRGRAGQEPLTSPTLEAFGFALASQLESSGASIVIGHDGRESGETLVAALADGLARGGVCVDVVGLAPTPAVAYLTTAGKYTAGIMVSASHNPAADNGVKLFGMDGSKLNDDREAAIEAAFFSQEQIKDAAEPGAIRRAKNLLGDYIGWLRLEAFPDLDLGGRRVLIDCANGAVSQIAGRVVHAFGGEAVTIHDKPDGRNINDGCGALHPEAAAKAIIEHGCWIGVSVDGDGDRAMLIDGKGRILDGDGILAGLSDLLGAHDALVKQTLVATIMSNLALEQWVLQSDLHLERTQVGDRYVAEEMRTNGYTLGGEKSGHMLFGDEHGFRGDGLYTLLKVCQELRNAQLGPEDFAKGYVDLPQKLLSLDAVRRAPLEELPQLADACKLVEAELAGNGRAVVRFSGTELKLRLMVEARTEEQVELAIEKLRVAAEADEILA
ncbi:MAG: phosphoglucosamine mutase [Planctomycetes bacterium]|nr:phosphoglucosamine mutase [Planctomycetota bacterium]